MSEEEKKTETTQETTQDTTQNTTQDTARDTTQDMARETDRTSEDIEVVPADEDDIRIQTVLRMREEITKQREAEERVFDQMILQQKMVDDLNDSMEDNLSRTAQLRRYNMEVQDRVETQVYHMHGITDDKRNGMAYSRSAYFTGSAFAIFLLSIAMTVLVGYFHGFRSDICLFMGFYTVLEGAVLAVEDKRRRAVRIFFRVLYFLLFPAMMLVFVGYEMNMEKYGFLMPDFMIAGLVIFAVAMADYFLYDPYKADRRAMKDAKETLKEIRKSAEKSVRESNRKAEKAEKHTQKLKQQEEKAEEKRQRKLEKKEARARAWEEKQSDYERLEPEEEAETGAESAGEAAKVQEVTATAEESSSIGKVVETVKEVLINEDKKPEPVNESATDDTRPEGGSDMDDEVEPV